MNAPTQLLIDALNERIDQLENRIAVLELNDKPPQPQQYIVPYWPVPAPGTIYPWPHYYPPSSTPIWYSTHPSSVTSTCRSRTHSSSCHNPPKQ